MYAGVPTTDPATVTSESLDGEQPEPSTASSVSPRLFARPQSITTVSPKSPTITFDGLRSR
jgi:hypothetical protein